MLPYTPFHVGKQRERACFGCDFNFLQDVLSETLFLLSHSLWKHWADLSPKLSETRCHVWLFAFSNVVPPHRNLRLTLHPLFVTQLSCASTSTPSARGNWVHGGCWKVVLADLEGSHMHTCPLQSSEPVPWTTDICLKGGRKSWFKNRTFAGACHFQLFHWRITLQLRGGSCSALLAMKSNQNVIKGKADRALYPYNPDE